MSYAHALTRARRKPRKPWSPWTWFWLALAVTWAFLASLHLSDLAAGDGDLLDVFIAALEIVMAVKDWKLFQQSRERDER